MDKGLTGGQLCELVEMPFQRFESLRRRARQAFQLTPPPFKAVDETQIGIALLVDDLGGGSAWPRYHPLDAIRLKLALELEAAGLEFGPAAKIVSNSLRVESPEIAGDRWVGVLVWTDDTGIRGRDHICGTSAEVLAAIATWDLKARQAEWGGNPRMRAAIIVNVEATVDRLVARVAELDLPWQLSRQDIQGLTP